MANAFEQLTKRVGYRTILLKLVEVQQLEQRWHSGERIDNCSECQRVRDSELEGLSCVSIQLLQDVLYLLEGCLGSHCILYCIISLLYSATHWAERSREQA